MHFVLLSFFYLNINILFTVTLLLKNNKHANN